MIWELTLVSIPILLPAFHFSPNRSDFVNNPAAINWQHTWSGKVVNEAFDSRVSGIECTQPKPYGANRMDRKIPMARNDLKGIVVLNDARTGVYTVMSVNKT